MLLLWSACEKHNTFFAMFKLQKCILACIFSYTQSLLTLKHLLKSYTDIFDVDVALLAILSAAKCVYYGIFPYRENLLMARNIAPLHSNI